MLDSKSLVDFMHNLGFIQHESDEITRKIKSFIEIYQVLKKMLFHQLQIIAFGIKVDFDSFSFSLNKHGLQHANELLTESFELSTKSKHWVNVMRCKYPSSLLFWMEELQSLHELLISNMSSTLESAVLNDLVSLASVSFPTELDHSQKCKAAVKIIKEIDNAACLPWFELVSQFLESWRSELSHLSLNIKHNPTKKL